MKRFIPSLTKRLPASWHAWHVRITPRLESLAEVLNFAARRARDARLAEVAGSLTFTTTLALVPLMTVVLALLTAFPIFAELRRTFEDLVLRELLPGQYASVILRYLNEFVDKAGRLTAAGLVLLLISALAMVSTVDRALNDIWQVRRRRPLLQRLLVYWALLTIGPMVIGASLSASSYLLSISQGWVQQVPGFFGVLLDWAPVALSGLAIAAMYVVVPGRSVRWSDALVGGFTAALFSEAMKAVFALYMRTGTLTGIYGAFAVLPLFLLWVYLSWFAVLFGAALAATLPRLRLTRFSDEERAGNAFITAVALLRLLLIARLEGRQQGRLTLEEMAAAVHTYPEECERLLTELERLEYVARIDVQPPRWILTSDPAQTTLLPLFSRLAVDPGNTLLSRGDASLAPWMAQGMAADWVSRPLAALYAAPPAEVAAKTA